MSNNGKQIIDPMADEAVRRAMMAQQQAVAMAVVQFELRDRMAMAMLPLARLETLTPGPTDLPALVKKAYEMADLMLRIRQEKPSEPAASEPARP